jgi:peptidyl-prolyl cis-trans isomerase A (cyclophilin A)/peptidyl-prolyl cis-trans isomerase B (cyclophilin B)
MGVKKVSLFAFLMAFLFLQAACFAGYPRVLLKTNFGDITMELYDANAPVTVENFLQYVRTGFYTDLLFHRVIIYPVDFMIQGGGYYVDGGYPYQQITNAPIINESYNNLSNLTGTVAMARTPDPNSATSQFYINLVNNTFLDRKSSVDVGYCVFGKVIIGMDVVNDISHTPVEDLSYIDPAFGSIPYPQLVIINSAELLTPGYWIPGDIGNDGFVNFRDFAYLAANWKKTGSNLWGDLNSNNAVDANDVNLFHQGWLTKTAWYKPIEQDLNNDGLVNFRDFAIFSRNWHQAGRRLTGNFNQDLYVDQLDLMFFAEKWLAH